VIDRMPRPAVLVALSALLLPVGFAASAAAQDAEAETKESDTITDDADSDAVTVTTDREDFGEMRRRWNEMSEEEREEYREKVRERWEQRRQEMREQRAEQVRESLGLTEEEMAVIQPRIDRVRTLRREKAIAVASGRTARASRDGGEDEGREDGGGRARQMGFGGDAAELSPAAAALRTTANTLGEVLSEENPNTDNLKTALRAFRTARDAMDANIDAAQAELTELLTVEQEAQLVMSGVLD